MIKIGFLSPFSKVGKTTIAIGLASKLANKGCKVLFFNFDDHLIKQNFTNINNPKLKLKNYLNKEINLDKIISPIHKLNLDLISFFKSDYTWLTSSIKTNVNPVVNKILLDLEKKTNKYDFCFFDFNDDFELINNSFIKKMDFFVFIINPKLYDLTTTANLLSYLKTFKKHKDVKESNGFFIILSMFEKDNLEINKTIDEIKFIFKDHLLLKNIPKIKNDQISKNKLNEQINFLEINKQNDLIYEFFIKAIFNI